MMSGNRTQMTRPNAWSARNGRAERKMMPMVICGGATLFRSEEHTSELQSLMRISYAVFCLKKKTNHNEQQLDTHHLFTLHDETSDCYNVTNRYSIQE